MQFIEHIIEPDRLLLSWQTSSAGQERQRLFVAELVRKGDDADLIYLAGQDEFCLAKERGFENYPGFTTDKKEHKNVLSSFMKRLPPRNRKDFPRFMESLRLRADARISDFALLGYSGAKLPDDDYTVIHPFTNAHPPFELLLPVQGYRYYLQNVPYVTLSEGRIVHFEKEPGNLNDPQAIRIVIQDKTFGYVCRGLLDSFHSWLNSGYNITASIERINGKSDNPKIFLFVTITR